MPKIFEVCQNNLDSLEFKYYLFTMAASTTELLKPLSILSMSEDDLDEGDLDEDTAEEGEDEKKKSGDDELGDEE